MKVIFFHTTFRSIVSILISIFTLSKYSHAAIMCDSAVYDAIDGDFDCIGSICDLDKNRKITIYEICSKTPSAALEEVERMKKECKMFSYSTIKAYIKNSESDIYCFKAVASILKSSGMSISSSCRTNANSLLKCIKLHNKEVLFSGYPVDFMRKDSYNS